MIPDGRAVTNILWQIYLRWLQTHAGIHKKNVFWLGQRWLGQTVITETHKADLSWIRKEMAGKLNDIKFYQPALSKLIKGLSADEIRNAEWTVVEWNIRSSPDEAQTRY